MKKRAKKRRPPKIQGMLPVDRNSRAYILKHHGIDLPDDVEYVILPEVINDPYNDFWDIERSLLIKREKRGEHMSAEELFYDD